MKKRRFGKKDGVVYVRKDQLPKSQPDQQPLPSSNAPTVEQLDKEEVKAAPARRTTPLTRGRPHYGRGSRHHPIGQSHQDYQHLEAKYNQNQSAYYYETGPTTNHEKVFYRERASRYKDYSKDAAAVSFYYEDFFKQFPNLNERSKEITKGLCECTQECIICQNKIFQKSKIWNCARCAQPYHLGCMKRWIVQVNFGEQYDKESGKSSMQKLKDAEVHWSCPNCTASYSGRCPTYKCFCGRRDCPDFSPYILPHSCGKPCDKVRHPWCKHMTCNILCHPGQCEPCQEQVELTCFCGKQKRLVPCCNANTKNSCGAKCGRLLSCGKHYCEQVCHEKLICNPCSIKVKAKCYCGKIEKEVLCGHENFACEGICGKLLSCGAHYCQKLCHPGSCGECELLPSKVKTCPCGKMDLELLTGEVRQKCTDPIAICGMPCGKLLPCMEHKCKSTCHVGPCPPCKELVNQWCRCGSTKRKVECYLVQYPPESIAALGIPKSDTDFLCKKRCNCLKSCRNHRCERLCCDVIKKYGNRIQDDPNGYHLCQIVCDKLLSCRRHRCPDFCHLGFCKPCPVISNQPLFCACGKTMKQPPIACGEELPYCPYSCDKLLPCGHKCSSKCHPGDCPPCTQLVLSKPCRCGKETLSHIPCSRGDLSCGKKCGKELPCGHRCSLICHPPGQCLGSGQPLEKGCGQKCNKPKPHCIHRCQEPCHPGRECSTDPCTGILTVYCECKTRKEQVKCEASDKPVEHKVACNEECARAKRKLALEKFAGVRSDSDVPSNPDYYPERMVKLAMYEPVLVSKIEEILEDLVLSMNQSGVPLPDMEPKKREIITELVQNNYYLDVGAYKTAKGTCFDVYYNKKARLPKTLLSQAAKQYKEKPSTSEDVQEVPFEATIYVYGLQKGQNINELKTLLGKYIYKYYVEKKGNYGYYIHFYDKKHAENAYEMLKAGTHPFKNLKLLFNDQVDEEEEEEVEEVKEVEKDAEGFEYA